MKTMKVAVLMAAVLTATMATCFAQDATVAEPQVLRDGDGAKTMRFNDMHMARYVEFFLAGREAKTGNLVAACYNTMLTPRGIPASRDSAPQALVEGLDLEKIKKEFGVVCASLNGPKIWQPD